MRRPPDLHIIEGGVWSQVETKLNPEPLWSAYVAAAEQSKRTLTLRDGIAAGKAYARFVQAFVEPNRRGRA
jgi:hypothetical protein